MPYFTECAGCGQVQSPDTSPDGWAPVEAGPEWLSHHRPLHYPTAPLMRCVPCYQTAHPDERGGGGDGDGDGDGDDAARGAPCC